MTRIADSQTDRKKGRRPKAGFGFDVAVGGVGYKSAKRPNRKRWKITVNQCVTMRFSLAVWPIGFVPLAEWRKAETLKLPVFTGAPEDSVIRHSASCVFFERADAETMESSRNAGVAANPHIRTLGGKCPKMVDPLRWFCVLGELTFA